ncbi:serine/threonine-protein kinase [Streptomyces mashuensis]|nr:serine/threonine-protein kinase [Streptomyces mashuensis]
MEHIGTYAVERVLGEGGMGIVYLARSRGGRAVAVKVARPELARDPVFRERFRAEVDSARRVGGFHTAPVVDADPESETPWLATAYIPGPTLSDLVTTRGPLSEPALRSLGAALAEALQAIHQCGLVHRDLKPGNIVMAEDGPRVLDFGISRAVEGAGLTVTGTSVGTPGFLSPEQAEGRPVTGASDVFALGAVLIAAAGGSPFGEGTPMALMYRSVHQEADLTAVPAGLRAVVAACMDKEPQRRPTPEQLLDAFTADGIVSPLYTPTAVVPTPSPQPAIPHTPAPPPPPPHRPAVAVPPVPVSPAPPVKAPELLAMDRKNAIVADGHGIAFNRKGKTLRFPWYRIWNVDRTWAGRELTVHIGLVDGTLLSCKVVASTEAELFHWVSKLDAVVHRFRLAR